jgi:hypothetical protein
MVVVVARKDLWKKEYIKCCFFKTAVWGEITSRLFKRENLPSIIIKKIALYFDFMGILGTLKFSFFKLSEYLNLYIDKPEEVICELKFKSCISRTELHDQYGSHIMTLARWKALIL